MEPTIVDRHVASSCIEAEDVPSRSTNSPHSAGDNDPSAPSGWCAAALALLIAMKLEERRL